VEDVAVLCAGVQGELAMDDAFCAGRIAAALGGEPADSAAAAIRLAGSFASNEDGLGASQSARNLHASGLDADIAWCAQESTLDVVPRFTRMVRTAAEVTL
jgi:phosphosulfolactate phosphohydrolase-like enzyme